MSSAPEKYTREADLCADFISVIDKTGDWICYPETAGFDILLRRKADDAQIGIEAKLKLNAKVIAQALPQYLAWSCAITGPDYRAVLVPSYGVSDLGPICQALGITVMRVRREFLNHPWNSPIDPVLPKSEPGYWSPAQDWHEWCPVERCKLPDYVPDVRAGESAPLQLSAWKIQAIKLAILLDERPVTRADFKALRLSPARWTDPYTGWLAKGDGGYIRGRRCPDFRAQHPKNYAEIEADRASWAPAVPEIQKGLGV